MNLDGTTVGSASTAMGVLKRGADAAAGPSYGGMYAGDGRGELQVHLALLAAQLMGIAQTKEARNDGEDNDTDKEDDPVTAPKTHVTS